MQRNLSNKKKVFGLIGQGRFGKLWAEALAPYGEVIVFDKEISSPVVPFVKFASLQQVAQADVVFLLVPISAFEECCLAIKSFLRPQSLIVDVCSVKMYPVTIMQTVFGHDQPLLATHPLFGPDSVKKTGGLRGHKIVVCPGQEETRQQNELISIFKDMGLEVLQTSPAEHDQQMAASQGLVHFIGRGLAALDMHEQAIATPDFKALLHINTMVLNDSWQLFLDMHRYNPYAATIRKKLMDELININGSIENDEKGP